MPKRQTKRKFLFPAVAITSILVTGGVAYWRLTQQQDLLPETAIGTQFIPQEAFFTVSLSTDAAKWEQLQTYGTPETKAAFNSQMASLKKRFLTDNGYNYQKNIAPWIGKEVFIGYLPLKSLTNRKEGQFIAVLPIADKLKAQQLLANKSSGTERTYRDIKINQQGDFATTVLGDNIIAATSPEAAEIAINTFLDKSGIGNKPAFVSALGKVKTEGAFANLYLNLPALTKLAIARAPQNFPADTIVKSQTDEGLVASINLEFERIGFNGVCWLKDGTAPAIVENRATNIPSLLPAETLMLVSGSNIKSIWENISFWSNISAISPVKAKDLENGVQSATGLSWEKDLLPWINQEFSLSLIPKYGSDNNSVGLVLMAKASDRAAASQSFSKLDAFVTRKYQLKVSEAKLADLPVTNWESKSGGFAATRGFLNQDIAFINLGDAVTSQILPKPTISLTDSPLFRLATDGNLNAISDRFFLDLEKTVHPGNLSIPKLIPQQEKYIKAVRGVGLTTSASDEHSYQFELSIVPKKL